MTTTSNYLKYLCVFLPLSLLAISTAYAQKLTLSPYKEKPMPLYLNCGNEIIVNIENYPYLDNIRLEAEGAEIIKNAKSGVFTVVPNAAQVIIRAYEGEKLLSESHHPVKILSKPDITLYLDGFVFNHRQVYAKEHLDTVMVKATIPYHIQEEIPKDTHYIIKEYEVSLLRGANVISELLVKEETVYLAELLKAAKSGDILSIEIKTLERINFKGSVEMLFSNEPKIFTIPID